MLDITEEKLDELFFASSKNTQTFITSGDLEQAFIKIEGMYSLTEEESRVVQEESLAYIINANEKDAAVTTIAVALRERKDDDISSIVDTIETTIFNKCI